MNYNEFFEKLASDNGKIFKENLMMEQKDNETLKKIFFYCLDPFMNYYIRKIPDYTWTGEGQYAYDDIFELLDRLNDRQVTGHAARDELIHVLENTQTEDMSKVLEKIIERTFRCGVSGTIANKVWPKHIKKFPVMLATASDTKVNALLKFPAASQLKADGMRFQSVNGIIYSRSGQIYDIPTLQEAFPNQDLFVYDGELWVDDGTGKPLPRAKGNGIIVKALKGTISEEELDLIHCTIWDRIDINDWKNGKSKEVYGLRLSLLTQMFDDGLFSDKVHLIDSKIVNNFDEVNEDFRERLEQGEEGILLKCLDSGWENKRVKHQIKYKAENTADLICTGVLMGAVNSKYEGLIGSLTCETSDGIIEVNVGSGLKDDMRKLPPEYFVGKIFEVLYNERIKADSDKKESLFLPRLITERPDKNEANSSEELV